MYLIIPRVQTWKWYLEEIKISRANNQFKYYVQKPPAVSVPRAFCPDTSSWPVVYTHACRILSGGKSGTFAYVHVK